MSCASPPDSAPADRQPALRQHLLDLTPMVTGPCAPQECTNRARTILAKVTAIKQTIVDGPDRDRFQPAVDIADKLTGVPPDSAHDPDVQRQIVATGVELRSWLDQNVPR